MLWRHLCLVRAWSAAGLLTTSLLGAALTARAGAEPAGPVPTGDDTAAAVSILDAQKAGDVVLDVRGAGQDQVKLAIKNTTGHRLKVVLPPGLVASSAAAQGRGGGGGFQSMGLGGAVNRTGGFGAFQPVDNAEESGFRSIAVKPAEAPALAVPAGESIDLSLTSVCLNFGIRTPNAHDKFELVDVDEYSTDPRVRKSLRSLATFGTSHGVAQAVMWKVCNDVPFQSMLAQAGKVMNSHEVALAARFVDALDASGSSDLVDPAYLTEGRLFIRVVGEGNLARDAQRLTEEINGNRVLGLPARAATEEARVEAPAVLMTIALTPTQTGETMGRIVLSQNDGSGRWNAIGKTKLNISTTPAILDGAGLARALDRAVSSAFVSVKVARRGPSSTTLRVDNHLPFTVANLELKAGTSAGAPIVTLPGLGIAPARSGQVTIEAPSATVEHIGFNGL